MTNELRVIKEQVILGNDFKIYGSIENPLFLAKDVAEWIDYSKTSQGYYNVSKMLMTVDDEEKLTITNGNSGGNKAFLTEDGLYEVLMQSRKPIAKQFKKKVKEILKDIRKHGMYMTDNLLEKTLDDPDFMIDVLTKYKEEKEKRKLLEQTVEEQRPLVTFAEKCIKTNDSILVRELAKLISEQGVVSIGEKKLYSKLREWGLILQNKTEPSQRAMDMNLFEVIQRPVKTPYGDRLTSTCKVLPKGQVYIVERLHKEIEERKVVS